ncbi:MAG: site-specific DNA-methyltransferase, partial [Acidimicrobiia bacterium]|nr:site-specific DNA-methyltransferase [Acidimicrobiia bacterium]
TNKTKRLLAAEDGSYEWVDPSDYRVAEVRLLEDVGVIGDVGRERAADNLLIRGDALNALRSLARLPEFARHYLGQVKLAYLDPPFNTQQSFLHYDDNLEHSVWLTMMRDRLMQIHDLLSPDGSVWVHLDDSEIGYCRVMMDEVFGPKASSPRCSGKAGIHAQATRPSRHHTTFSWSMRATRRPGAASAIACLEPTNKRSSIAIPTTIHWAPGGSSRSMRHRFAPISSTPSLPHPATLVSHRQGRHWSMTEDRWNDVVASGRAYFGKGGGGSPGIKRYLSEVDDIVPNTWWSHEECGHTDEAKKELMALFPRRGALLNPKTGTADAPDHPHRIEPRRHCPRPVCWPGHHGGGRAQDGPSMDRD